MTHRLWPALLLAAALPLVACPPPEEDDDDDVVAPPDDDDDCDVDLDCDFTTGLEICGDEGVCIDGDRNNERAEAQLVEYNTSTQLFVAPAGDVDWFRFSGTQGDLILITTEAEDPETLDTVVQYYDEDGNEIAFNDDFDRVSSVPPTPASTPPSLPPAPSTSPSRTAAPGPTIPPTPPSGAPTAATS